MILLKLGKWFDSPCQAEDRGFKAGLVPLSFRNYSSSLDLSLAVGYIYRLNHDVIQHITYHNQIKVITMWSFLNIIFL